MPAFELEVFAALQSVRVDLLFEAACIDATLNGERDKSWQQCHFPAQLSSVNLGRCAPGKNVRNLLASEMGRTVSTPV